MPVLSLACHLPHNAPHIAWRYNYEQTTKQTKAINNSYIYISISCKCDTNRAGHLTLDAYASRPVACIVCYADSFGLGDVWAPKTRQTHDDVIKWKHFSRYWPFVRGIHRSPVNSPHKVQWRGALMFVFFDLRVNKRLSKQSWGWWFETLSRSLWRHCYALSKPMVPHSAYRCIIRLYHTHADH